MIDDLTENNHHFRLIFASSAAAMILVDEQGLIRLANQEAERLFGYACGELVGKPVEILVPHAVQASHQLNRSTFYELPQPRPMGQGRYLKAVRKDGVEFPAEIGLTPINLDDGMYVLSAIIDLTFQKQIEEKALRLAQDLEEANKRLAQLARTDELTGLKNRRAFDEGLIDLVQLMDRMCSALSLLLVDVDHFKRYNDHFGHLAGDELLKTLAELLLRNSRDSDLVARYGGDEFVILLPGTNAENAVWVGERIRLAVQDYPWQDKRSTISLGAATTIFESRMAETPDSIGARLLLSADRALYRSKRTGRNKLTHFRHMEKKE